MDVDPSEQAIEDANKDAQWHPQREPDKVAANNWEFLGQFLNGTGKDIQEHTDHVQFQVINIAGERSWSLHAKSDLPLGSEGPHRRCAVDQNSVWFSAIKSDSRNELLSLAFADIGKKFQSGLNRSEWAYNRPLVNTDAGKT